jgi:hypothetical protein
MNFDILGINQLIDEALLLLKKSLNPRLEKALFEKAIYQLQNDLIFKINEKYALNQKNFLAENTWIKEDSLLEYIQTLTQEISSLSLPLPDEKHQISVVNMVLSTSIGTLLLFIPLHLFFSHLLGFPQGVSYFISFWIAMIASLSFSLMLSQDQSVKRFLHWSLGLSFALEVGLLIQATSLSMFSAILSRSCTQVSFSKRIFSYIIGFAFLKLSKKESYFELEYYDQQLGLALKQASHKAYQMILQQWTAHLNQSFQQLERQEQRLSQEQDQIEIKALQQNQNQYASLLIKIAELQHCQLAQLPFLCTELLQLAKIQGFKGVLEDLPIFEKESKSIEPENIVPISTSTKEAVFTALEAESLEWQPSLLSHYNPFGAIRAGDWVYVEQAPVIVNDQVLEKGLVRKKRK